MLHDFVTSNTYAINQSLCLFKLTGRYSNYYYFVIFSQNTILDRKRTGQSLTLTSAPCNTKSCLYFICDRTSNTCFLVDTGAEVSVCPPSRFDRQCKSSNLTLQAANNISICTYDTKLIALNLGLCRSFKWVFIIADVQYPIIGIDFLQCHKLLVDVHNKHLLDTVTHLQVNILASSLQPLNLVISSLSIPTKVQTILSNYPDITQTSNTIKPIKHHIQHYITANGQPVASHPRHLSPE